MELTVYEKQLIIDHIFYHFHSQLNSMPDDRKKFNAILFRAITLNFLYTAAFGLSAYLLLGKRKYGLLRGYCKAEYIIAGTSLYSVFQFYTRYKKIIYSHDTLDVVMINKKEVERYNDHYRRIYGNK